MTYQNKNKNRARVLRWSGGVLVSLFTASVFFIASPGIYAADDVGTLNEEIEDRRKEIDILQKEIDAYQEQIKIKQKEARSLQNQVAILENQIAKLELDIQTTEKKIEQTNLEIQRLNIEIKDTENQIDDRKNKIGEYIRLIHRQDETSIAEIVIAHDSFSEFFDQVKYTEEVHSGLHNVLTKLKALKEQLQTEKNNWQAKAELEQKLKTELQQQHDALEETTSAQRTLYGQAKLTERQYQSYSYQLKLEQQQINADLVGLEKQVRQKLAERKEQERFNEFGPARLAWPVSPSRGISAFFHDPGYPFRYIFEHPAVDIRVSQGTDIKAPESGYVARVKFAGDKSYAYIMLIHNDGISTVYGHVSAVYVKQDDFVSKGQMIGKTGATPGTTGAGPLTTGPHLHFEVRLNGIPVNPLEYLSAL